MNNIQGFYKARLIFILALLSSIAPLSTDMYLPALSLVQNHFNSSSFLVQLSIASFFVAFALGQLIYGPISDAIGRKKPIIFGMGLFIVASFFCFMVENIYVFIFLRFLQALGGCAGVVMSRAIVNDSFKINEAAGVFALMMVVSSLAPMISPSIGGLLLRFFHWHSIFVTLFCLGIFLIVFSALFLKESNKSYKKISFQSIIKSYKIVFKDKVYLIYAVSSAMIMSCLFVYITGSSFVFTQVFKLSEQQFGLVFGINSLGFMLNARINAKLCLKYPPKVILGKAFVMIFIFSIMLFAFSFLNNVIFFCIGLFCTFSMLGYILPNTTTLAMARFKEHSGTASAVLGALQFLVAGFTAFIVGVIGANTPTKLALLISISALIASNIYFLRKFIIKAFRWFCVKTTQNPTKQSLIIFYKVEKSIL